MEEVVVGGGDWLGIKVLDFILYIFGIIVIWFRYKVEWGILLSCIYIVIIICYNVVWDMIIGFCLEVMGFNNFGKG